MKIKSLSLDFDLEMLQLASLDCILLNILYSPQFDHYIQQFSKLN